MRIGRFIRSISASFVLAAVPALGAGNGWYVGVSAGQAQADGTFLQGNQLPVAFVPGTLTTSADDKDTAWKGLAGYRFNPYLAAEVVFADYGSTRVDSAFTAQRTGTLLDPGTSSVTRSVKSLGIDLLGGMPVIEGIWVFGRLGWVQAEVESNVSTSLETTLASGSFFSDFGEGQSRTRKSHNGSAKFGAGIEWSPTNALGVRLEWERVKEAGEPYPFKGPDLRGFPLYRIDGGTGEGSLDMWSVGVVWRF
jgi:hypothetical protein